jgi:hypothetical protein
LPIEFGQEVVLLPCIFDLRRRFPALAVSSSIQIASVIQRRKE